MLNGARLEADNLELYPMYVALADGSLPEAEFAAWLRQHITLNTSRQVHEPGAHYERQRRR